MSTVTYSTCFLCTCIISVQEMVIITLIKTGDAHKKKMMSQTIINTFKKCEGGGGDDMQPKMMMLAK